MDHGRWHGARDVGRLQKAQQEAELKKFQKKRTDHWWKQEGAKAGEPWPRREAPRMILPEISHLQGQKSMQPKLEIQRDHAPEFAKTYPKEIDRSVVGRLNRKSEAYGLLASLGLKQGMEATHMNLPLLVAAAQSYSEEEEQKAERTTGVSRAVPVYWAGALSMRRRLSARTRKVNQHMFICHLGVGASGVGCFPKLWEVRSWPYRSRLLQPKAYFAALF